MDPYLDAAAEQIRHFEGSIPWMYLDTVGKVTTGVGLLLPSESSATSLPFRLASRDATPTEIATDFARVSAMAMGHPAAFYRAATSPLLPDAAINDHLRSIVSELDKTLSAALPNWATTPNAAKLALLDMAYNLGAHGLLHGFPKLMEAVRNSHWTLAATLCERHGPASARNDWTRKQFLASVLDTVRAEAAEIRSWPARIWHWLCRRFPFKTSQP